MTEEEMIAHLRSRGYIVKPPVAREVLSQTAKRTIQGRRERGELDGHMAMMRAARKAPANAPRKPDPPHGDVRRYHSKRLRCRCDPCTIAKREYDHRHLTKQRREARDRRIARARLAFPCDGCGYVFFRGLDRSAHLRRYCSDVCKGKAAYRRAKQRKAIEASTTLGVAAAAV